MSLLNPTEAPAVHLEVLPSNAKAVSARWGIWSNKNIVKDALTLTTWVSSPNMSCSGGDPDAWLESNCHDCQYYTDEVELEGYGSTYTVDTDFGEAEIRGTFYVYSPCPCYNDGLSSVDFPCQQGLDGPEGEDSDRELDARFMRYQIVHSITDRGTVVQLSEIAHQQKIEFNDGVAFVGEKRRAINTFSGKDDICWGDNTPGTSLLEIATIFGSSPANEDLLSFDSHDDNAYDCANDECEQRLDEAIELRQGRAQALVCATIKGMANAYLLLASSGSKVNGNVAYINTYLYKKVAVNKDTILDLWVTDVLPIGKRLAFVLYSLPEIEEQALKTNAVLLGQIDADFDLSQTEETKQLTTTN